MLIVNCNAVSTTTWCSVCVVICLLQMKPYNIYVTVAYPPDTDTPGLAEENKTKVSYHNIIMSLTFSPLLYISYNALLPYPPPAVRDQVNLGDLWGLSARASGQNCRQGCCGKTLDPTFIDLLALLLSSNGLTCEFLFHRGIQITVSFPVWFSLLLQQGNFNSSVGPDGYMLSALTCGMSPVTSITEGLQQVQSPPSHCPCHLPVTLPVTVPVTLPVTVPATFPHTILLIWDVTAHTQLLIREDAGIGCLPIPG